MILIGYFLLKKKVTIYYSLYCWHLRLCLHTDTLNISIKKFDLKNYNFKNMTVLYLTLFYFMCPQIGIECSDSAYIWRIKPVLASVSDCTFVYTMLTH